MLNRRQRKYARARAQGMNISEAQRHAECAPSTAAAWEKHEGVIGEIEALKNLATSEAPTDDSDGPAGVDLQRVLEESLTHARRRGDDRAVANLAAQLRLLKKDHTASSLVAQLKAVIVKKPHELVEALELCIANEDALWSRIEHAASKRLWLANSGKDWHDLLAAVLGGQWLRQEERELWITSTKPLLDLCGVLVRGVPQYADGKSKLRGAIANARAALDDIEKSITPTSAAGDEPAQQSTENQTDG